MLSIKLFPYRCVDLTRHCARNLHSVMCVIMLTPELLHINSLEISSSGEAIDWYSCFPDFVFLVDFCALSGTVTFRMALGQRTHTCGWKGTLQKPLLRIVKALGPACRWHHLYLQGGVCGKAMDPETDVWVLRLGSLLISSWQSLGTTWEQQHVACTWLQWLQGEGEVYVLYGDQRS